MTQNTGKPNRGRKQKDVVRRAAAAAAASTTGGSDAERRSRHKFLALVAAVIVAGSLVVGFTWADRQYNHPTVLDSWQNAYAVFDCTTETWLEPFDSLSANKGIRSRADGIIYIEPADESVAGDNATLDVFLDAVGASVSDDTLVLPDGSELSETNAFCSDEEAYLQVLRWHEPTDDAPSEIRYDDLAGTPFDADRESFVIALAPAGAGIPLPPSAADLPPIVIGPLTGES